LKALVIGLGVLIVLGTALVIGVVVKRFMESTGGSPAATTVLPAAPATSVPFNTVLPGGEGGKIAGVAASGGAVAVWVRDDKGGRIDFIDPRTGALLGTAIAR
jgi:hypothetical protein